MSHPVLEARDLLRRFSNGRGVGPLNLLVSQGEVLALVGPNGCGKTTLLRCLATRSTPGQGEVLWFGDRDPALARPRLGVVFDATAHADELSARENLAFFASARGAPVGPSTPLLSQAELSDVADEPVASYSYGMRRRLLLAEALAGDPELLLLDEPTLGLDVAGQRWLADVLQERAARGTAVCISTNDTEFVESAATRVCFLVDGLAVHDSHLDELLASLGGSREIHLTSRSQLPVERLRCVPGVEGVALVEAGAIVLAHQREGLLADLLATMGDLDRTLVDLSVREPGLADCFLRITGRALGD